MIIEEQVFKDKHPIIVFKNEKGRIFLACGLTKVKLILENIEVLKAFLNKHTQPEPSI